MLSKRLIAAVIMGCSVIILSSCGGGKRADKTFDICFASAEGPEDAIRLLRGVSDQFGYRFSEYGESAKIDLETVNADRSIIPEGRPVQADIKRDDGKVLLIASNFGGAGDDLRMSFFYQRNEGEGSPFFRAVQSGMASLPNSRLYLTDDGRDVSACMESG